MSPQRRNRRAGVEDLWRMRDRETNELVPTRRDGKGMRWRARWIDPSGVEKTKAFRRKVDAQDHIDRVTSQLVSSTYVDPAAGRLTVGTALDRLMNGFTGKPKTRDSYASVIKSQIAPRWANVPLEAVVPSEISAWLADIQTGKKGVSAARARHAGLLLRKALDGAVDDRLLAVNPAARVKLPRPGGKRSGLRLTVEQLGKVSDAMPSEQDRALLLTLALTGLRWGEAVALQAHSVDFDRKRLTVERTYVDIGGRIEVGTPKSHSARWVPLPDTVAQHLRPLTTEKAPNDDVFRTSRGDVIRSGNWTARVFRPALTAADCDPKMRIHDLRGTFASIAIQSAQTNIKALQRALGHESAALTLDTYGSLYEDDLSGLGDRMDSAAYSLRTSPTQETKNP